MTSPVGQTISHYKILELLGGGGMGVVYKARDLRLDRLVALKFLPPDLTRDSEARQRFVAEAKAASSLDHPNICVIHEIDEAPDGQTFIVMGYYEGETLKKKIERGPIPVDQAVEITLQISRGLARAHEAGIVHRDIKPANIITTTRGEIKILDFGLAKLSGRTLLTKSGTTIGTAAYMSPEQARTEDVDARTDIWSSGVVLYEMLAGRKPFESDYPQALVYAILNEDPRLLREIRPDAPADLEEITRRAMAKEPNTRYQTAAELITDLESYKKGAQLSQKTRIVHTGNRKLLYIGAGMGVLAVAGVLAFLATGRGEVYDRVAVLPFRNLSKDSTQEWLADGMTEEVIARLQHVGSLNVPSIRGTIMYRASQASYADIARELRAKALVDASIVMSNNRIRVLARLIDPAADRSLWSETYDGTMDDILDLQARIAQALVRAVRVQVTHDEADRIARSRKVDPKAYELFLKARHIFLDERTAGEREYAVGLNSLQQAIAVDSSYPAFYCLLSAVYQAAASMGFYSAAEVIPLMEKATSAAISLDDHDSYSQLSLAFLDQTKWDWSGAEKAFLRALEISPGDPEILLAYAHFLAPLGRSQEAISMMNRSLDVDPSLDSHGLSRVLIYSQSRRYDDALRIAREYVQLYPDDPLLHVGLGWIYGGKGLCDSSVIHFDKALELGHSSSRISIGLDAAQGFYKCGQRQKAQALLNQYLSIRKGKVIEAYWVAATYAAFDDTAHAYQWLEMAYRERSQAMIAFRIDDAWDSQHSNPRYRDMLKRLGLEN